MSQFLLLLSAVVIRVTGHFYYRSSHDTRYWQAAAFGHYAALLDGVPKGKACILIGYPKPITRVGKGGNQVTEHNGFQVVNKLPYLGTPKPR